MPILSYESLPRAYPNRFVPDSVDCADWSKLESFFADLERRPIASSSDLEHWLDDYSELFTAISEEGTIRYIRMTEQTESAELKEAYMSFLQNVEPKMKAGQFSLNKRYIESEHRKSLPSQRFSVLDRKIENSIKLFRENNIGLETEDRVQAQKYQEIMGSMTVEFDGRARTLSEMGKYLEETDREVRKDAWLSLGRRLLADREKVDGIFDSLVSIRDKIASNAGFANYRDYAFLKRERFDYSPEDCFRFHDAVADHIVPLLRQVYEKRRSDLNLDVLRPWDAKADPFQRPPLRPFKTTEELVRGCHRVFEKVSPQLMREFDEMATLGLLDLESRPGKAQGGYNTELPQLRLPFIFTNAVGRDDDLRVILHESGHAFQVYEMRDQNLHYLYRGDGLPSEMAEVASMSMELVAGQHLEGAFYDAESAARSTQEHLLMVTWLLGWIATIDAFQHWVYTHPGHTREERNDAWVKVHERFGIGDSWEGLDEMRRTQWHRQLHLFENPFYYIEYGIAQLGALGIWTMYLKDPQGAVDSYRSALRLGGSKPLPELFRTAGLPWDFGSPIVEKYARELKRVILE